MITEIQRVKRPLRNRLLGFINELWKQDGGKFSIFLIGCIFVVTIVFIFGDPDGSKHRKKVAEESHIEIACTVAGLKWRAEHPHTCDVMHRKITVDD